MYADTLATARQIVNSTGVKIRVANYGLDSCNDQGDPPYQGTVVATFDRPMDQARALAVAERYQQQLIKSGWSPEGAGVSHSTVSLTKSGYLLQLDAVWLPAEGIDPIGAFNLFGPCEQIDGITSLMEANAVGGDIAALLQ
ncbi:MAG: hypothetical protein FWD74_06290 [Actinomycetia bacterium]|nr:hypothetical protein [Actinomycetes bacterium]